MCELNLSVVIETKKYSGFMTQTEIKKELYISSNELLFPFFPHLLNFQNIEAIKNLLLISMIKKINDKINKQVNDIHIYNR